MPVKQRITTRNGLFFISFTCYRWLPLIAQTHAYDIVYRWFDYVKAQGHFINGYVIMPNHVHLLISFVRAAQPINTIIGNGKRFMAYAIIQRLKEMQQYGLLQQLQDSVETRRKENNKQHNVWELSFDWKECKASAFTWQKLDYIHRNPCSGKWQLAASPEEYPHSSALYYLTGKEGVYPVRNFREMDDVALG